MTVTICVAVILLLVSCFFDIRSRIIPNWICGSLVILYALGYIAGDGVPSLIEALPAAFIMLGAGFIVFSMNWLGGGDVKLATAAALYIGIGNLAPYTLLIGLLGGVLSLFYIIKIILSKYTQKTPDTLQASGFVEKTKAAKKVELPYGVAIAGAALLIIVRVL